MNIVVAVKYSVKDGKGGILRDSFTLILQGHGQGGESSRLLKSDLNSGLIIQYIMYIQLLKCCHHS